MSEKSNVNCSKTRKRKCKVNVLDYLIDRSIKGYRNNSSHFTNKLFDTANDLYKKDLTAHFGCVNAIEFSSNGDLLFSGGDDRRVLMWNMNDAMMYYSGKSGGVKPYVMKGCHYSNIFCLAVDDENKRVLSGSNDDQVIVHDYAKGIPVDVFSHESPVFSLSLHPANGNIFASAGDNGKIAIFDIRESNADLFYIAKLRTPFHGVMFNPREPSFLATANSKVGIHLWDLRKPREVLIKFNSEPSMAVRWSQNGKTLLALRNLLPVVLYDLLDPKRKVEFDSGTYFNACTMKSCCFAGPNDEYILSGKIRKVDGSDDFNLYVWKVPNPWPESRWLESEHLALSGHRSIVNQVRFAASKQLIATSGVEKIIKIWSPFRMPYSEGDRDKPSAKHHRVLCSSKTCTRSPGFLSHDYSQESVEEDTRMIHFFDSLLQNELDYMPDSFYPSSNLFTVPSRKRETRFYLKLIRKKKKYLSKLLIKKNRDGKPYCSIKKSIFNGEDSKSIVVSGEKNSLNGSDNSSSEFKENESNLFKRCQTKELSPTRSVFTPGLQGNSSSQGDSSVGSVNRSPISGIDCSDSERVDESSKLNLVKKKLKLHCYKTEMRDISENTDSDQPQSSPIFKKKRCTNARYRKHSKREKNSGESDSSDSEIWVNNCD